MYFDNGTTVAQTNLFSTALSDNIWLNDEYSVSLNRVLYYCVLIYLVHNGEVGPTRKHTD